MVKSHAVKLLVEKSGLPDTQLKESLHLVWGRRFSCDVATGMIPLGDLLLGHGEELVGGTWFDMVSSVCEDFSTWRKEQIAEQLPDPEEEGVGLSMYLATWRCLAVTEDPNGEHWSASPEGSYHCQATRKAMAATMRRGYKNLMKEALTRVMYGSSSKKSFRQWVQKEELPYHDEDEEQRAEEPAWGEGHAITQKD
eukprot:Skav201029  [mRNA]  locus=scaffold3386:99785:108471:+ [translate_table: standard]